jgi:hypothetical protein
MARTTFSEHAVREDEYNHDGLIEDWATKIPPNVKPGSFRRSNSLPIGSFKVHLILYLSCYLFTAYPENLVLRHFCKKKNSRDSGKLYFMYHISVVEVRGRDASDK